MRSVVWRVGTGACNWILHLAHTMGQFVRSRALIIVAATATITGCAPYYYEPGDGAYDAADAVGTSRPRPKAQIPTPSRALLRPQPEPKCEEPKSAGNTAPSAKSDPKRLASADASDESARPPQSAGEGTATTATTSSGSKDADASLALALRIKLEYERECYRQAETRARGRLNDLQTSVAATVKAMEAQKRQQ